MPDIIIMPRNLMNNLLNVAVMDIRDFPTSETSEHEVSTPTPNSHNIDNLRVYKF